MDNEFDEKSDGPEIIIDSIYPATTSKILRTSFVADKIGTNIGGFGRHFIKDFELAIKEGLLRRGIKNVHDSDGNVTTIDEVSQRIYHNIEEYVHDKLYGGNKGRFAREEDIAIRAVNNVLKNVYGETIEIQGWEPGLRIKHKNGDVFELTGNKCKRCHVNPEAYGHGGGIRCFDVNNCGYWFCY